MDITPITTTTMDAVTSFSSLIDNLPSWKDQVKQLHTYTGQKHEEFRAEYTRIVSQVKPKRVRSPSLCSIHTDNNTQPKELDVAMDDASMPTPTPPNPVDISPFEAGNRYIYAQATKKRKLGTSFRSGASGPVKFRSKQMVVIYYDSHAQEQLGSLVKSIGGSRNNLRKGKMAYTVSKGLQLPTLSRKYDAPSTPSGSNIVKPTAASGTLPKTTLGRSESAPSVTTTPAGEDAFKHVDKDLETCQNLCETAAHQFLRDGDCKLELDTVLQNLDRILEYARIMLDTFKAEEKRDESTSDIASVTGSTHTQSDTTLVEKSSRELLNTNHKLSPFMETIPDVKKPSLPITHSAPPAMTDIEVDDDSDQSSIEIDLAKFRMTSRAGNRAGLRT